MSRTLFMGLIWLFLCVPSFAQTLAPSQGSERLHGWRVPGATVTAVNKATNATRTPRATPSACSISGVAAGTYMVKTELEGFKTATRDVELQVQQTARINFTLELGVLSETATVIGVSPLSRPQTRPSAPSSRTDASSNCAQREKLSPARRLSPNVSADFAGAGQSGTRQGGTRANQQLSVSGQRREFNYYTLDGVDNTDVNFNTYIFLPSVDALEEFKVQTGVYSANSGVRRAR